MSEAKQARPNRSGLAKGWTSADVAELEEITAELGEVYRREQAVYDRFNNLLAKVKDAGQTAA